MQLGYAGRPEKNASQQSAAHAAYFFLDLFVSFLCQDKNESPSGRIKTLHHQAHAISPFQTTDWCAFLFALLIYIGRCPMLLAFALSGLKKDNIKPITTNSELTGNK